MDLPSQIIAKILDFLDDIKDIKTCLLVSHEFKEIIIKTPKLMRKLDVILFATGWKLKTDFIQKYGEHVIGLKLLSVDFESESEFLDIIKLMPNIERLNCRNCEIDGGGFVINFGEVEENILNRRENSIETGVNCENLNDNCHIENPKSLEPIDYPQNFQNLTHLDLKAPPNFHKLLIKCLETCKTLRSLKLLFMAIDGCDYSKIVNQQDNLEELCIESHDDHVLRAIFNSKLNEKPKFRLKRFSAHSGLTWNEKFMDFLKIQSGFIEELELICYRMNFRYFKAVLNDFKVLKNFSFFADHLLTEARVEEVKNFRMESVKNLEFQGRNFDLITFKVLIEIFPNIEALKLENLTDLSLHGILDNFKKLSVLQVDSFSAHSMLNVSLPSLKILEIGCLFTAPMNTMYDNITVNCPNIEEIKIDNISHMQLRATIMAEYTRIFRSLVNLKNLKVFKVNSFSERDFDGEPEFDFEDFGEPNYLVKVDVEKKKISAAGFFIRQCQVELNLLREIFINFNVDEI